MQAAAPVQPDVPNLGMLTDAEYERLIDDTKFELYWPLISQHTFSSKSLPLSETAAKALVSLYDNKNRLITPRDISEDDSLSLLAKSIDDARDSLGCKRVFVRLSTRSPKDAVLEDPSFEDAQKAIEVQLEATDGGCTPFNRRMHAFYEAARRGMGITRGVDALCLLALSRRTIQDLRSHQSGGNLHVVVREFNEFDVSQEFRVFICRQKITAASSYITQVYFPQLSMYREEIARCIQTFLTKELLPVIQLKHLIVDVVLLRAPSQYSERFTVKYVEFFFFFFPLLLIELLKSIRLRISQRQCISHGRQTRTCACFLVKTPSNSECWMHVSDKVQLRKQHSYHIYNSFSFCSFFFSLRLLLLVSNPHWSIGSRHGSHLRVWYMHLLPLPLHFQSIEQHCDKHLERIQSESVG